MSQVIYNGVTLNVIRTKEYRMEPVYDDSDTDLLYVRHRLSVVAVVAAGQIQAAGLSTSSNPAALIQQIRHLLTLPRRQLTYSANGVALIATTADDAGLSLDAAKGPIPRILSCTQICLGSFLVEWVVEYHDAVCDDGNSSLQAQGIMSLRWSQSESVDERWYRRLSTTGQLITRTDLVTSADVLAAVVVPQPPLGGYLRTRSKYTLSEDGTRLHFEFEDQQKFKLPPNYPNGATLGPSASCIPKVDGKFTIVTNEGASFFAEVRIHMEGVPYMSTQDMIEVAASIAVSKIQAAGPVSASPNTPNVYQAVGSISEGIWDNTIDFALRAQINSSGQERFEAFAMNPSIFGQDVEFAESADPGTGGIIPDIDPAFLTLVAAAFQDPCVASSVLASNSAVSLSDSQIAELQEVAGLASPALTGSTPSANDTPPADFSFTVTDLVPGETIDDDGLINDPVPGVWENLMIESTYTRSEWQLQLPTMQSSAPAAIVQLAGPTAKLSCAWTATKMQSPPTIPPYVSEDANLVPAGKVTNPAMLTAGSDGVSLKYTISGRYDYLVIDASTLDDLACPVPPWLTDAEMEIGEVNEGDATMVLGDTSVPEEPDLPNEPVNA